MGVHGKVHARISWNYWFKRILYYQVALVYVLTRLVLNVSQVSTPCLSFCMLDMVHEEDTDMTQGLRNIIRKKLTLHACI